MALKVKCKCGTMLKVPSAMADKRVTCPGCKKGFILPAAKFALAGSAAKKSSDAPTRAASSTSPTGHGAKTQTSASTQSASAGLAATAPQPTTTATASPLGAPAEPSELDLTPSNLDLELAPSNDDLFGDLQLAGGDPEPLPAINVESVATIAAATYARDASARSLTSGRQLLDPISGPRRGYWADAFYSFVYPFRTTGNVLNLCVILFAACLMIPLSYVGGAGFIFYRGLFLWIPRLIIFGWIRALYLNVVVDTAAGIDDMPGIRMEDGMYEDVFRPAMRYIGAYACALLPTVVYVLALALGLIPASLASPVTLILWLAAGIFLWPMFVILFAFNASAYVIRLDLIVSTIFRTILPYLAMWVMLMLVGLLSILPLLGIIVAMLGMNISVPEIPEWGGMAGAAVMIMLDVYFTIVSMRIIGLYYLHFKHRFTMTFE